MQARLLKNDTGYWLLFIDGTMIPAEKQELTNVLFNFKTLLKDSFRLSENKNVIIWKSEFPDIFSVPGDTFAYITDAFDLVILDFAPFVPLFADVNYFIEEVLTAAEYAKKHNKSVEQIKVFCRAGRIPRAKKLGRDWVIPPDAPYPFDRRLG